MAEDRTRILLNYFVNCGKLTYKILARRATTKISYLKKAIRLCQNIFLRFTTQVHGSDLFVTLGKPGGVFTRKALGTILTIMVVEITSSLV